MQLNTIGNSISWVTLTMPTSHTDLPPRIRRDEVREARAWLMDCFGDDDDAFAIIDTASAITIFMLVQKHYEGGWDAFIKAGAQ